MRATLDLDRTWISVLILLIVVLALVLVLVAVAGSCGGQPWGGGCAHVAAEWNPAAPAPSDSYFCEGGRAGQQHLGSILEEIGSVLHW